ncbi:alpha-ketoglutarate-dependent dioxygenase alkB homolog 4-like isoform X1 [Lampris incognitus]|uniref:alpha-ketoglutarate-dependent dioxygenase alkB homolog 4-like isoform X1 n=2 Tax=Lampris incognitus TaxID=2546036 RepID=UPI0024B53AFC|nr:alpha-ketoglutarate-dependent dioxygenase alkB homolog 4-like isoform X1 [Lampris incognitus]
MMTDTFACSTTCGCKGVRTCLSCEDSKENKHAAESGHEVFHHFWYDPVLKLAARNGGEPTSFPFPGVVIWENFISEEEESEQIRKMDQDIWNQSQSGRKKQDFGPKVNFKRRKLRLGKFCGLPEASRELVHRMLQEPLLANFQPVEQCNLDYNPQRGSAIDPHLDDSWLWGERLVTINMLSDTTLTMSLEKGLSDLGLEEEVRVAVRVPRRSLLALHSEARHKWKHAIHRKDVEARRVCITFRELSAEFLPRGQQAQLGAQLLDIALSFQGTQV